MSERPEQASESNPLAESRRVGRLSPGALSAARRRSRRSAIMEPTSARRPRVLPAQSPPSDRSTSSGQKSASTWARTIGVMGIWEAMEFLNTLVDDSDPDTDLTQIEHLMQTAEAIRADGHPRWFILTGLIHDLGKVLCLFGEPQWAVVGDTFPVGCRYSDKVVFPEFFARESRLRTSPVYQTECGIYEPGCGLDHVHMSWGHDEYLYHVVKDYLPEEGLAMIRYHSFYAAHREGAYNHLMNDDDRRRMEWVRSVQSLRPLLQGARAARRRGLRPYYEDLIAEFFPAELAW